MLVLTRKTDERLLIDGGIEIRILGIQGSRVRLGIEAPREVRVRRAELENSSISGDPKKFASDEYSCLTDDLFSAAEREPSIDVIRA
jgi:carbon storage regulator